MSSDPPDAARVRGFPPGVPISTILLGELFLQVALAIPVGLALGRAMAAGMMSQTDPEVYRLPTIISPRTYAFATAVTLAAALLSAAERPAVVAELVVDPPPTGPPASACPGPALRPDLPPPTGTGLGGSGVARSGRRRTGRSRAGREGLSSGARGACRARLHRLREQQRVREWSFGVRVQWGPGRRHEAARAGRRQVDVAL